MCGFFITNSSAVTYDHSSLIEKMLRFRGPDGSSGLQILPNGWLAYHSRLAIIDIDSGVNQPMIDSNGGVLVFNGEILNYRNLANKYFQSEYLSDTKLLSDLIINDFLDLNELDGFFSFVYVDLYGELKYAVRDRFGVKPLFYYEDGDQLTFCSEPVLLKSIFKCSVNLEAVEEYYAARAPIFSDSYYKGVHSVQPGECYITGPYFDALAHFCLSYKEVDLLRLKNCVISGIKSRLVSDAPSGLLISRGVDSNLIRSVGNFNRCYSIGFEGDDDLEYLKSQDIEGLKLVTCTPEMYKRAFNFLLNLRGEPLSVPNEVLLYLIALEASNDGVKVLLSGEGADEFFGGYDRIFKWAHAANKFDLDQFLQMYCYVVPTPGSLVHTNFASLFNSVQLESPFELVRWFFIRFHMPVLFRRLDFALMAAGVEGREPLANMHVFMEAMKISPDDLMGDTLGKIPLRKILKEYMGSEFSYEEKIGFPVNLREIFDNYQCSNSYDIWFKENLKVLSV